jgi:type IV/VI secretion system ImpK/VasF family protein
MKQTHLCDFARPFLLACIRTQRSSLESRAVLHANMDSKQVVQRLLDVEHQRFEVNALRLWGNTHVVGEASYFLCSFADELMTELFGLDWMRYSLLAKHHNDSHGGERCWQKLNMLLRSASKNWGTPKHQLLELCELVIASGLRGKYRIEAHGEQTVQKYRIYIRRLLEQRHPHPKPERRILTNAVKYLDRRKAWLIPSLMCAWMCLLLILLFYVDLQLQNQWQYLSDKIATDVTRHE